MVSPIPCRELKATKSTMDEKINCAFENVRIEVKKVKVHHYTGIEALYRPCGP
jgi:hypothetical protein